MDAFEYAIREKLVDMAQGFLKDNKERLNDIKINNSPLINFVIEHGTIEALKLILESGVDLGIRRYYFGLPIEHALKIGNNEAVKLLALHGGADSLESVEKVKILRMVNKLK